MPIVKYLDKTAKAYLFSLGVQQRTGEPGQSNIGLEKKVQEQGNNLSRSNCKLTGSLSESGF